MPGATTGPHILKDVIAAPKSGDGSVSLFLSLYLLLFAFFILLVAISNGETAKTREIMEHVGAQFAAVRSRQEAQSFSSDLDTYVSPSAFMNRVAAVYETAIPAARMTMVVPGRLMEMRFHVDSLFEHDTDTLRAAQRRAIAQLISSLSLPPPGLRYEAEAVFGVDARTMPVVEDLAIRRAGVTARAFLEEGAPRKAISVALEEGDPTQARFVFRVVAEDERRLDDGETGTRGGEG
jgi:hypothetical protein